MESFELGIAVSKIHDFIWDEFCDWYIEIAKQRIWAKEENKKAADCALWTLKTVLSGAMKLPSSLYAFYHGGDLLHPSSRGGIHHDLQLAGIPGGLERSGGGADHREGERHCKGACGTSVSEMNVAPSKKIHVIIVPEKEEDGSQLDALKEMYQKLMNAGQVTVQADKDGIGEDAISLVVPGAVAYLPLDELVDKEKERERLLKEEERLAKELKAFPGNAE